MAAPTNAAKREESSCQPGAVHTWHFYGREPPQANHRWHARKRCDAKPARPSVEQPTAVALKINLGESARPHRAVDTARPAPTR